MVEYLLTLAGISDPIMEDGTTAFTMALARGDGNMMKVMLYSDHESDINPRELLTNAVSAGEQERETYLSSLLRVLGIEHYVPVNLCQQ